MTMGCPIQSAILPSSDYQSTISVSAATEKKKLWIHFGNCKEVEWPAKDKISTRSAVFFFCLFLQTTCEKCFPAQGDFIWGKSKAKLQLLKNRTQHFIFSSLPQYSAEPSHPHETVVWFTLMSHLERGFPPTGAPGQEHDIQGGAASLHFK